MRPLPALLTLAAVNGLLSAGALHHGQQLLLRPVLQTMFLIWAVAVNVLALAGAPVRQSAFRLNLAVVLLEIFELTRIARAMDLAPAIRPEGPLVLLPALAAMLAGGLAMLVIPRLPEQSDLAAALD